MQTVLFELFFKLIKLFFFCYYRNIFIKNNRIKLTDFGLIYSLRSLESLNSDDVSYMSPELVQHLLESKPKQIACNSDLFSTASVVYEMINLEKAFSANSKEEIVQLILTRKIAEPLVKNELLIDLNSILEK